MRCLYFHMLFPTFHVILESKMSSYAQVQSVANVLVVDNDIQHLEFIKNACQQYSYQG